MCRPAADLEILNAMRLAELFGIEAKSEVVNFDARIGIDSKITADAYRGILNDPIIARYVDSHIVNCCKYVY